MQSITVTREILGKRLREARLALDISPTRAAAEIDVSADTLANYESGRSEPSYLQVLVLSQLYGRAMESFGAPVERRVKEPAA